MFPITNEKAEKSFNYSLIIYEQSPTISEYYIPVIISIISKIDDPDSFKEILGELILITQCSTKKNIDILNYLMFNYNLLIPPNHCLFELKYKYSSVNMYFPSVTEVPTMLNDSNIKLLFSVMNTSIIIKLYCCLLTERKIVLVSETPTLLYKICNGLFKLIFPFEWMHTFIPVIDEEQIDLLEAPVPYVIGLVSVVNNLNELSTRFTESVFVNIDTNEICLPANTGDIGLSEQEENDIKKNIQKLKHAELLLETNNNNSDLNVNYSFSKNVLNLFFKRIERVLRSYKQYLEYCNNEYYPFYGEKLRIEFNEASFKNDILKGFNKNSQEMWNKVINSNVFLDFINNNLHPQQFTNTYTFNHIVNDKEQVNNTILNAYIIKLKINDFNKEFVLDVVKEGNSEIQNEFTEYYNNDNNSNDVYKGYINISNKQTQQYINLFENKHPNQSILNTPLVSSLNLSISNEFSFDNHINSIINSNSFYGNKGFISFIKQLSSIPNFNQLLTYHLTQISQELQNNNHNKNNTQLSYFEFPLNQPQINKNYDKFFQFILTALYLQANLPNNPNPKEFSLPSHIATLYKQAHSLNNIEFPYYKYYTLITSNTSSLKQSLPKDSILLYEIQLDKPLSNSKGTKQFPETSSSDFLSKISVEIKKEIIQERTSKLTSSNNPNSNNNSNANKMNYPHIEERSDIASVNSIGRFSLNKIRCLKTDLTSYTVINKKIHPPQQTHTYSPTQIINNLFKLLIPIYTKNKLNLHNAIKTISEEDYLAIKNNIGSLKKINISKITDMNSKICFWLNLFNILLLFTLIYTRIEPNNINQWKEILINAYFDIGGYEIALRNFYFQFLNVNFLVEQASKEKEKLNPLMKRFVVNGIDKFKQYLLVFGIHLPGFHNENLIKFEEGNVFEQLSELFNSFVMKNVKFNKEKKYLFITEMFLTFDTNFLFESYKMCESILNKEIYEILDKTQYVEIKMLPKEEASRIDEFVSLNEILPEVRSSKVNK